MSICSLDRTHVQRSIQGICVYSTKKSSVSMRCTYDRMRGGKADIVAGIEVIHVLLE